MKDGSPIAFDNEGQKKEIDESPGQKNDGKHRPQRSSWFFVRFIIVSCGRSIWVGMKDRYVFKRDRRGFNLARETEGGHVDS